MTKIILLAGLIALTGCAMMPEHQRLRVEKMELARELRKQKQINADREEIRRLEDELEMERYKW